MKKFALILLCMGTLTACGQYERFDDDTGNAGVIRKREQFTDGLRSGGDAATAVGTAAPFVIPGPIGVGVGVGSSALAAFLYWLADRNGSRRRGEVWSDSDIKTARELFGEPFPTNTPK